MTTLCSKYLKPGPSIAKRSLTYPMTLMLTHVVF